MGARRPWRAVSFRPDPTAPNGRRRNTTGRTAAVTEAGLQRFVDAALERGDEVDVWEILAIDLQTVNGRV